MPGTIKERLLARVSIDSTSACWNWQGSLVRGYGAISVGGKQKKAHRVSYETFIGPIPDGLTLDHLCRNRACVNPAHLDPVTLRENIHRSDNAAGINHRRTHCKHGHPLSGENLWVNKHGYRHCRTCNRNKGRERNARLAALRPKRVPLERRLLEWLTEHPDSSYAEIRDAVGGKSNTLGLLLRSYPFERRKRRAFPNDSGYVYRVEAGAWMRLAEVAG